MQVWAPFMRAGVRTFFDPEYLAEPNTDREK
jgi:hypothetical protein